MGFREVVVGVSLVVLGGSGAFAENLALIVGNSTYKNFPNTGFSAPVSDTVSVFQGANYRTIHLENATEAKMKIQLDRFESTFEDAQKVVVVLAGHFLHAGSVTWFAPVDLRSPSLGSVSYDALPLSAILSYLEKKPGAAALFLGESTLGLKVGTTIDKGIGNLNIPQGVLVVQGTPNNVSLALQNHFLKQGKSTAQAAKDAPLVTASGFVSSKVALNNGSVQGLPQQEPAQNAALAEVAFWRAVEEIGSKASYQGYLRRYPGGEFEEQAKHRIQVIEDSAPKFSEAEQGELDLGLTRNDRRRVQEHLTLIGFDPRGVDGVFGPGSRKAIARWQGQNGVEATGYLTQNSLRKLRVQAERRAARLAQESRRKQQKHDQADANFWAQTGARNTEADFLAYLKKFPKGLYADTARFSLERIEKEKRKEAKAVERRDWDLAVQQNTVEAYRQFIKTHPDGTYARIAQGRIDEQTLSNQDRVLREKAKREEVSLQMSPSMKVLIERKLTKLGLDAGRPDGEFNKKTRKALRQYQKSRGIQPTGFVTRHTIIRLMAE